MNANELKGRTKKFAINVIHMTQNLDRHTPNFVMEKQIIRSATSVGANYRSSLRGKSGPDFLNKIKIVEEEADECCYWLELLSEINNKNQSEMEALLNEAKELTAIFSSIAKTMRAKLNKS